MKFLQHIQQKLLLNYPIIWSSRVVPALFFSVLVNLALFLLFFLFSSPWRHTSFIAWIPFLSLSSLIAVIVYLIFLLRFNHFKIFGKLKWTDFALQFVLYFLVLGSISLWPFMPRIAAHVAVSKTFTSAEMEADLWEAYLLANQLEYTEESLPYRMVTVEIAPDEPTETDMANNYMRVASVEEIDRERFVKVEKKSDNLFLAYEKISLICSSFPYGLANSDYFNDRLYREIGNNTTSRAEKEKRLDALFDKYISHYEGSIYQEGSSGIMYKGIDPFRLNDKVCEKYRLEELGYSMDQIEDNLFHDSDWEILFRIWFYITFYASLLLLIFRYMSLRTFLWTFLFTFLLFVFSIIVGASFGFEAEGVLGMMLFYYLIFTVLSIFIFVAKARNVFLGIALNLSFFCLQLLPLVFFSFLYELRLAFSSSTQAMELGEITGFCLVLLSIFIFHSKLFYKWFSLPED